ncbi:MAG: hypothetical protein H6840_02775 [Planctomycetes bacterium]|nr:hypothetical protein [Planctomycetota bacterium]
MAAKKPDSQIKIEQYSMFVAARAYAESCTVPIVGELAGSAGVYGTGTLFRIDARFFLITAGHVTDALASDAAANSDFAYGIPTSRRKNAKIQLPHVHLYRLDSAKDDNDPSAKERNDPDVSIYEFLNPAEIADLQKTWHFLQLGNVSLEYPDTPYMVFGFPAATTRHVGTSLTGTPLSYVTAIHTGDLPETFTADRKQDYLLIKHMEDGFDTKGRAVRLPPPKGISGCSVWAVHGAEEGEVWAPTSHAKVVAVETAYCRNEYIRGTKWPSVLYALSEISPDLEKSVDSFLRRNGRRMKR